MSINRDEWLKALSEAGIDHGEDDQDAITVSEFCELFHVKVGAGHARLKQLVEAGKATQTHKRQANSAGKMVSYLAYRLQP